MARLALLATLLTAAALPQVVRAGGGGVTVYRTWYGEGYITASGSPVFDGEAGCGSAFPFGTVLDLDDGQEVVCLDRGYIGAYGVDVYCDRGWAECQAENPAGPIGAAVVRWGGR